MTSEAIARNNQSLDPGDLINLFTVDLTVIGYDEVWRFSDSGRCTFQGLEYVEFDCETEGFEWNGQGALPQPIIRFSNTQRTFAGVSRNYQDLVGAKFTRLRTYKQFLDDQPGADPDAYFTPDIYVVEQKSAQNKTTIEWTLSASMDQQGRMIPGRQVLRDLCMWRYRVWNNATGAFDYTRVQCPYSGTTYLDGEDLVTSAVNDECSRTLNGCKARFGANAVLPYGGFPGVSRNRI